MHIYTRELLDKHLQPEFKEIALALGVSPAGNKTYRETCIAALVGQPFPLFQSIADEEVSQVQGPIEVQALEQSENPPGVDRALELIENSSGVDRALEPIKNSPVSIAPWN
jgi:hypothetical protein